MAAYMAGLFDGIAGQVGVHFRWDEQLSTVVVRGHEFLLEWIAKITDVPAQNAGGMSGEFWSVDGRDLLELLEQLKPYAVRKAADYDQMIEWLKKQPKHDPGIMPT